MHRVARARPADEAGLVHADGRGDINFCGAGEEWRGLVRHVPLLEDKDVWIVPKRFLFQKKGGGDAYP